jgi:osomolarity two-component system sensor histidine kinase CHK1
MLKHILQASGAQYVALVVAAAKEEGRFDVKVSGTVNNIQFHENIPLDDNQSFAPTRLIRLAANSRKAVIDNAKSLEKDRQEGLLPKSFIALPIRLQEKTLAILYLSNSEINDLFSSSRQVELLTIMATHTAISIEKIELLSELSEANRELSESKKAVEDHAEHLEFVVEERTKQLAKQNTELAAAKYEAEQASLRKNRFLSNISHEIRTPFNAVVGFATLLMDTDLDSDQRDMAQSIVDSSSNLLVIINDLLDLTKMEEGKMNLSPIWFDFRTLMESTLEMIARSAAQKQIDIAFIEDKHSSEIGSVFADDIRMRQSILNLLSNAIKFTDQGGLVRVTSRSNFLGEADAEGNQSVRIFVDVQDNGIGIAKQDMSKLFGFFSQVDDSTTRLYGGTGLGLAISRKICRLFDGDLTVESESGVGSTFTASFCGKVNRKTNPPRPLQCKALSKQTCMILEPSSIVQEAIQQHLDAFGVPWFSKSDLAGVAAAVERADFCIIGDSFNEPETIRALRKRWVDVERLPLVVTMPFGSTLPAQPTTQDEDSIDAVLSTPIRRNRLLKALLSLFPGGDAPVIAAQPPVVITDNDSTEMKNDIKILLVEDNLVNVKVATKLLKRLGYVPKVAYDGLQAVQACAIEDFDLILMDVMMPVLSGLAATQEIRAAQAEDKAPFICAMTANAMAGDEERCLAAGMDKYISKPIMLPKLKEVISTVEKKVQLGDCKG